MAFFDEISSVHKHKVRRVSVHPVSEVYLGAHYF